MLTHACNTTTPRQPWIDLLVLEQDDPKTYPNPLHTVA